MRIIYCDSVFDNIIIEPDYEIEKNAALKAGFDFSLISFDELIEGNITVALKYVKEAQNLEIGIYRGWMLKPNQYQNLYEGLLKKNIQLLNNPIAYKHCHYLPDSYNKIKSKTPKSYWTRDLSQNKIIELTAQFGTDAIIVKDFVKSEKHHWQEACFIPDASNAQHLMSVVNRFIELRSDFLNEGLVFRRFEELEFLTKHSKSGMPLTKEFRIFFVNKKSMGILNYWDEGDYSDDTPNLEALEHIVKEIESNFFTMDVAKKKDGDWMIMELGDAQVAGLPDNCNREEFYKNLKIHI